MNERGDYTYFWWRKLLQKHTHPWKRLLIRLVLVNIFLVILFYSCSPAIIFEWQRTHFADNVKKRVGPEELRMWATNLFPLAATTNSDSQRVTNRHPVFPICQYGPTIYVFRESEGDPAHVLVFYGSGGGGHWGIEIGTMNRPTPQNYHQHEYSEWAPGIFFFRTP